MYTPTNTSTLEIILENTFGAGDVNKDGDNDFLVGSHKYPTN